MSDLSKRIAALSPEQRQLFEQRLKQRGLSAPTVQVIPKRPPLAALPLSFGQQQLWFLHQLDPGSPAYNAPSAVRLSGPLDISAVERCLNQVVRRHEALRTRFALVDERPVQIVDAQLELPLPLLDLRAHPAADREAEALRLATIEFQRPFDLQHGPLLRAQLLRLDEDEYILLFTMHHIITDGWSTELLIAEVTALYGVFATGQPAEAALLPEPQVQYPDFAIWQREYIQGAVLESQLAYWRKQLGPEGAPAPKLLDLPTDRPRPAVQSYHGGMIAFELEQPLPRMLQALAQREGVTMFMLTLAAFDVLLGRWSGQDDLVVGTMVSGRSRSELSNVMGYFANNLMLRASLAGDPTFRELLERVRLTALAAYSHQDVPFELLVEQLNPDRSLSHAPLAQVSFTLQGELVPTREVAGVTMRPLLIDSGATKLDLIAFLWEGQDRLSGTLEYSADLFERATIERLIGHFKALLQAIAADPDQRISQLPLLTAAERQLLREWNATATSFANVAGAQELWEAQAARTPEADALVFVEPDAAPQRLCYADLNRRANQLAHYLRTLGVGPETPVAVKLERTPALIIALLAILKAGGAYLPLDPSYPAERLQFMLDDAGAPVLLISGREQPADPAAHPAILTVDLDADNLELAQAPVTNPARQTEPDQLAYIIYTSGSTGRPKGVLVPHRGLCNLAQAQAAAFAIGPESRVLQFASSSFDASISEIVVTLLAGATLVLAPRTPDLPQLLHEQAITAVTLPPSVLSAMPAAELSALQTIVAAGEACPAEVVARWQPGRTFINAYGPTETTVCATIAACDPAEPRPPIGRPIANTQVYVLDQRQALAPIGVVGELYIGGVGVARGYLHRPDLTAAAFIPDPFGAEPGARLYRTGDLARYRADGQIEFWGRSDQQVKLRGFRIELGEIEAALRQHPDVQAAAVLLREDVAGDPRLTAYVVSGVGEEPANKGTAEQGNKPAADHRSPIVDHLRAFLRERLPDYMIPSVFVTLDALPLTASGKLDRAALPAVGGERPALEQAYVAPRTPTEEVLAMIWADVLGVERVGVHDNFFDLGGHSLRAIVLLSRVRDAFQISLSLQTMFDSTTVASLAALLIRHETQPGRTEKIARLLQRIKGASRDELQASLEQRRQQSRAGQPTSEPGR
jgi:amino acid adenylation domain-containing protein